MHGKTLKTPIQYLKGVGDIKAELLKKELEIFYFRDLLLFFPYRYVDKTKYYKISEITPDMPNVQIIGKIAKIEEVGQARSKRLVAEFYDDTGRVELVFFKGLRWIKSQLPLDTPLVIFGKPQLYKNRYSIPHPEIEPYKPNESGKQNTLEPVYSTTEKLKAKGLSSKGLFKLVKELVDKLIDEIPENLPDYILQKYTLIERKMAVQQIHFPQDVTILQHSKSRLKYEELFFIQINLLRKKYKHDTQNKGIVFTQIGENFNVCYSHLPFDLTGAQKRVIKEIRQDCLSGKQMNRLLQGDVGSGKTLVALFTMLMAIDNGYQAAIMAPTEILAQQHFFTIQNFLQKTGIQIALLTGSTKASVRKEIEKDLQSGNIQLIAGTHALIEDRVQFANLGIAVIDEQHRFGVAQRAKMWAKNVVSPHILVMTATPIPRTLSMTLYGDLDVSVIDELPPGRKPVQTIHGFESARLKVFGFLQKQISLGRQVYIVYPLIEESEKLDLKNLEEGYEAVTRFFKPPKYQVSIVHGKMRPKDKDFEMNRFKTKQTQIMISTTVIEVGVDVPNASVMVIENAERFGLSQLHQLRGRVGRGADQSYCILMTKNKISADAKIRIGAMVETNDGFKISEVDLNLRGPGDVSGTKQSGLVNLKIADLKEDTRILQAARNDAKAILANDPMLEKQENKCIKDYLLQTNKNSFDWGVIS